MLCRFKRISKWTLRISDKNYLNDILMTNNEEEDNNNDFTKKKYEENISMMEISKQIC